MGTILTGYGDAGYDHEGYAAQVLDDGSITGTHSDETAPRMIGYVVAACDCGWTGTTHYPTTTGPFDEDAEQRALTEWEHQHARPALEDLRASSWERLRPVLRGIGSPRAALTGAQFIALPAAEQRAVAERTLRALDLASGLARELRDTSSGGCSL